MDWLVASILLSVVLTLVLNVVVRLFPGGPRHVARWFDEVTAPRADEPATSRHRVRVVVPWKTMIAVSIVLTVVINVVLWLK